jgi:multiple sugar transport system substrate-binding protein
LHLKDKMAVVTGAHRGIGFAIAEAMARDGAIVLAAAFRRERPDVSIEWTVRPLSDLEHQPIAAIADRFDLMIIDHPFCGDIAASGACLPLEEAIAELGPDADRLYVGPR